MNSKQINVILYGTNQSIHYKYESKYSQSRWNMKVILKELFLICKDCIIKYWIRKQKRNVVSFYEGTCLWYVVKRLKKNHCLKIDDKSIMDVGDLP